MTFAERESRIDSMLLEQEVKITIDERFAKGTPPDYIQRALSDPEGQLKRLKASLVRGSEIEKKLQPEEPQRHESNPQAF